MTETATPAAESGLSRLIHRIFPKTPTSTVCYGCNPPKQCRPCRHSWTTWSPASKPMARS